MISQPEACAMVSSSITPGISGRPGKCPSKIGEAIGTSGCARIVRPAGSSSKMRSMRRKYSSRMPLRTCARLGGDELVDARAQVLQHEILLGRRLALVDLLRPLLEWHLDPECLVDGKRDIEEVETVDAEIVDGVAFRLDGLARNITGLGDDIDH